MLLVIDWDCPCGGHWQNELHTACPDDLVAAAPPVSTTRAFDDDRLTPLICAGSTLSVGGDESGALVYASGPQNGSADLGLE